MILLTSGKLAIQQKPLKAAEVATIMNLSSSTTILN